MRALKGLLIYVGIVLGIILGIGVLLFGVMYFVPSFRIAGVGVVHSSDIVKDSIVDLAEYPTLTNYVLNVSSKNISININSKDEGSDVNYSFGNSVFGIAYDMTEYKVIKSIEKDGDTLKINITLTEPNGLISAKNSSLNIFVPKNLRYSIMTSTNAGSIDIGTSKSNFEINNLTISTTSGRFTLGSIGTTVDESVSTILNSLNLSTNKGLFDLRAINNLTVLNTIKLQATNGTFMFDSVNASFNVTGKGIKLDANTITTDSNGFKFISENGYFDINKIVTPAGVENTIVTENCDVKINEITGRTGIVTTYGNINIGTLSSLAILQSEHGNVTISKALEDIKVTTKFGNITVNSYLKSAKFVSIRGNINVKSTGEYIQNAYTEIENTEGQVNVDNKINKLLLKTYGSSKCEITFREIKGGLTNPLDVFQHKIDIHKYGSALVLMPTVNYNTPFKFKAKGDISGRFSGVSAGNIGGEIYSSDEYQYYPQDSEASKEASKQSCYFEFYGTIRFEGYNNN